MKWTVIYRPSAIKDLAEIWEATPERQAVTAAADEIDRLLSNSPTMAGESREGSTRLLIVPPLSAVFDVAPDDMQVFVWRISART
jgi:plasmid stabilization system protein ParE